jgi:hypothetical protein
VHILRHLQADLGGQFPGGWLRAWGVKIVAPVDVWRLVTGVGVGHVSVIYVCRVVHFEVRSYRIAVPFTPRAAKRF